LLTITIDPSSEQVRAAFLAKGPQIVRAIVDKLNALMIRLQAHIVSDKLSGQVLHHRTGTLANSIRVIPAQLQADKIVAGVEGAGGPAWYGRPNEFGAHIPERVPVNARALHWTSADGESVFAMRARAFDLPARSFMGSSLDDYRSIIPAEISAAVTKAITP